MKICIWCKKKRDLKYFQNKHKKICIICKNINIKFGKYIVSFD